MDRMTNVKNHPSRINLERASLHLEVIAILSAMIFVLSFTFEVLVWYSTTNIHLTLVLLLEFILGVWAIFELETLGKSQDRSHFRVIRYLLLAQILMSLLRWAILSLQSQSEVDDWIINKSSENNWHFLCLIPYSLLFIGIHRAVVGLFTLNEKTNAENTEKQMLKTLNALALARDNETGNHIIRTQHYVKTLALRLREMGNYKNELDDHKINLLFKAAPLHDIGKVGIPDQILQKSGRLNDDEWLTMKTHTTIGETVLSSPELDSSGDDVIENAIKIAGGHHEKWDGSGYPRGLKGTDIPLPARIMALADVYDALVSERVYKSEWSHEDAVQEIVSKSGINFDPVIVDAFVAEKEGFRAISQKYKDG